MIMFKFRTQPTSKPQAALYVIVFGNLYVKLAVSVLLAFMFLQPVASVYAAEEGVADSGDEEVVEEVESELEPEVIEEEAEEEVAEEVVEEVDVEINEKQEDIDVETDSTDGSEDTAASEQNSETDEIDTGESLDSGLVVETEAEVSDEIISETQSETEKASSSEEIVEEASETTATSSNESAGSGGSGSSNNAGEEENQGDTASTTAENIIENSTTAASTTDEVSVASTTEETLAASSSDEVVDDVVESDEAEVNDNLEKGTVAAPDSVAEQSSDNTVASSTPTSTVQYIYVVEEDINDSNRYQFSVDECVSVGDGSFYCNKSNGLSASLEDGVYAEADDGGDREIYLRLDGEVTKITDNEYDEASPQLDQVRGQIVWHRLISGRYQIIQYDIETGVEKQLTDSAQNNMEPTQNAGIAVWQTWSNDNWDIALYEDGEINIISENQQHDVAPEIRNGYVIWHTTDSEGQKLLTVYELATGVTSSIADPDGGHVENPRFVLVYDTEYENGDKVTKQYDPETGEIIPVSSQPATPLPDLPDPEPAGEETALLTNKNPNSKEDGEGLIDLPAGGNGTSSTTGATITDTSIGGSEVSINTEDVVVASTSPGVAEEPLPLTEFDLIVEPFSTTSSAQETDTGSSTNDVE